MGLSLSYGDRYSRQILMKYWDQEKISNATVLIPGVGALGTVVSYTLAQLGIGKLILVDFDYVEESNLSRQKLFTVSDIGRAKVIAARDALLRINPNIKVDVYPLNIFNLPEEVWKEADVYGDGLDSFRVREHINAKAIEYNKPYVFAGTFGWHGNVQVIIPGETPCLDCYPMSKGEFEGSCTLSETRQKMQPEVRHAPAAAPISDVIGGMEANEIIKIILGIKSQYNYWFYNGLTGEFFQFKLQRNPKCPVCSDLPEIIEIFYMEKDSLKDVLKRHGITNEVFVYNGKLVDINKPAREYEGKILIGSSKRVRLVKK